MGQYAPQFSEKRSKYGQKATLAYDHPRDDRSACEIQNSIADIFPQRIFNGHKGYAKAWAQGPAFWFLPSIELP
jgi:hypothetical protein